MNTTELNSGELAFVENYLYDLMALREGSLALRWTAKTGTTGLDIAAILKIGIGILVAEGREPLFEEPIRPYAEPWATREEARARNAELAPEAEAGKEALRRLR